MGVVEKHRMGIVALGHTLFPSDRWGPPCDVPGVVIIGEQEQLYAPYLEDLSTSAANKYCAGAGAYVNLADLPGGILMDEIGVPSAFGGCAGASTECRHLARALPACLVFCAGDATHSTRDYTWALRAGLLKQVSGPSLPSTHTCSSRSSLSTRAEARSLST